MINQKLTHWNKINRRKRARETAQETDIATETHTFAYSGIL